MPPKALFVPLFVNAQDDPRLMRAGDMAELMWYRALQSAKRTPNDGIIDLVQLLEKGKRKDVEKMRDVAALVREGLLRPLGEDRYRMAGWLGWNESEAEREAKLAADRERKSRGGKGKDSKRNPDGFQSDSGSKNRTEQNETEHPLQPLLNALLAGCNMAPEEMDEDAFDTAWKVVHWLDGLEGRPDADEVTRRCRAWPYTYPITPPLAKKHWAVLAARTPDAPDTKAGAVALGKLWAAQGQDRDTLEHKLRDDPPVSRLAGLAAYDEAVRPNLRVVGE